MPRIARHPRYLTLALPHLSTDRIARARWGRSWISDGRPEGPPLVVTDTAKSAIRLVALEPGAEAHGLMPGQTLADARALRPDIDAVPADRHADADVLAAMAAWADRYTPLVGLSGEDGLVMDITGVAHLFGGEEKMLGEVTARLRGQGFHAGLAIADTPGAGWALARHRPGMVVPPGDQAEALAPLPVSALRIAEDVATGLVRVGLKTIGCIAPLPRAPLATRFGQALLESLDRALGRAEQTISPLRTPPDLVAEKRFFDPIVHEDDIARTIALLAEALVPMLEDQGLGGRRFELRLFRVDGVVESLDVAAANPLRRPDRIAALFRERIAGLRVEIDAGFGFDLVKLAVCQADPFPGTQGDLVERSASQDNYEALVDRLGARLGTDRVRAFAVADTHIPERTFGTVPVTRAAKGARAAEVGGPVTRPVWLLARPEPVDTVAEVPDGPPLRFRWRKVGYEVARSEGPERIACEWWRDGRGSRTRDYFRVEATEGHRFWMFRNGLYGREVVVPRWYMHGVFS